MESLAVSALALSWTGDEFLSIGHSGCSLDFLERVSSEHGSETLR
ncbi:MAG: hypothetical protein RBU37_26575 [Myxococcota bacterium]|nr:hypothetical protein [Myxococcota bacterium]